MNRDPVIGRQLANYKIESILGRGGMATVYYARDISLQRPVAVKIIDTQLQRNVSFAQRFISEARAIASWRHENIVHVYYADQEDDLYYFVMEHINGLDLETLLEQYADEGELMPHADIINIAKSIASAIDYAHQQGVIHRDIKPSNVMIDSDERVVLMDFGLALDTQQGSMGEVFGTPHYVSPEQARRSADAVPQSDVYSLAVMLYEMLTGIVPFDDPSPTSLALQHLTLPPPPPRSINPQLNQATEDVLLKSLSKQAEERHQTATELIENLEEALNTPVTDTPTSELPPLPPNAVLPKRSLSSNTVTERIAVHIHTTLTQEIPQIRRIKSTIHSSQKEEKPAPPPIASSAPVEKETNNKVLPIAIASIIVIALIIIAGLYFGGMFNQDTPQLPTVIAFNTDVAQVIEPVTAIIEATHTLEPATTIIETTSTLIPETDTPLPTQVMLIATDAPLSMQTLVPTQTLVPVTNTPIIPTATVVAPLEPTVLYPSGRAIQFIWDDNSFYWYNATGESLRVSSIAFEALTESGTPTVYNMDGSRWSVGFNSVERNKCDAIEITQSPTLRPAQCQGYNAFVNPQRSSDLVFWLSRDTVSEFRVLWNDEEVGRCQINQGVCEVRIP